MTRPVRLAPGHPETDSRPWGRPDSSCRSQRPSPRGRRRTSGRSKGCWTMAVSVSEGWRLPLEVDGDRRRDPKQPRPSRQPRPRPARVRGRPPRRAPPGRELRPDGALRAEIRTSHRTWRCRWSVRHSSGRRPAVATTHRMICRSGRSPDSPSHNERKLGWVRGAGWPPWRESS